MASVTGMTAEAIDELMNDMVVSVGINEDGQIIYTTRGGSESVSDSIVPPSIAIEAAWPVGSIFIGAVATNPAALIGVGTWARFGQGKLLASQLNGDDDFGALNQVGGAKTVSIEDNNLPPHSHDIDIYNITGFDATGSNRIVGSDSPGGVSTHSTNTLDNPTAHDPIAILPPYITVYMWKRTS